MLKVLEAARAKCVTVAQQLGKATSASKKKKKKKDLAESEAKTAAMASLFASLNVEEPIANPLGSPPEPSQQPARINVRLEMEDKNDSGFKCWCFLQDLADIRNFARQSWEDWAKGELSFSAAGIITDTAFSLLHRASDEFAPTSPFGSKDWNKLLQYLGISYLAKDQNVWLFPAPSSARRTQMPDSNVNVAELLNPVAFLALQSWKADAAAYCEAEKRMKSGRLGQTTFA